jgi:hypothetical protein
MWASKHRAMHGVLLLAQSLTEAVAWAYVEQAMCATVPLQKVEQSLSTS